MPFPPHLKYIIPGAILSSEGGGLAYFGFEFKYVLNFSFLGEVGLVLMIIGIISLCIGLPLLFHGLQMRQFYTSISTYRKKNNNDT